jgi:hypothetical protein
VTNELSLIKKDQRKKHFIAQVSNEIRQGANFKIKFTKRRGKRCFRTTPAISKM